MEEQEKTQTVSPVIVRVQDQEDWQRAIKRKQDEFLDVYSLYIKTGIAWIHDEVKLKAYELHLLDPKFTAPIY
ncbi:MAG: hypothetical protein PHN49_06905 [Candidatus Omnitrophica bacterium]|nr:hypothetical protein [Candidatus Omnitrophota bacterium]MDD5671348.1 hypothetical protein [Candidatus Omnitrophota bacterium]